jgi:hypothetical protein
MGNDDGYRSGFCTGAMLTFFFMCVFGVSCAVIEDKAYTEGVKQACKDGLKP